MANSSEQLERAMEQTKRAVRLSNGIVLKIKPVSSDKVSRALSALKKPTAPMEEYEDNDGKVHVEENIAHPDYLAALDSYAEARIARAFDVYFGLGTSFVSVPEGMYPPESEQWCRSLKRVGIPISDDPDVRYIDWVTLYAVQDDNDKAGLVREIIRRSGTLEADVFEAVSWFQRSKERRVNNGVVRQQHSADGDKL